MYTFLELIESAIQLKASDLHITSHRPPSARIDGELKPIREETLYPEDTKRIALEIMDETQRATFEERGEFDFAFSAAHLGRFRINVFRQRGSWAVVARVLNSRIPLPHELGMPQSVVDLCTKKRGIILVTGPTGSGKSTTLASMINTINRNECRHVITLEDPIEYLHRHEKSVVNQREIGIDTKSYSAALRGALRQDPDVLLVGEMRDLDTIGIAITAAETGHLVFSTVHTIGAMNTIDRVIDVFPPEQQQQVRTQLADVLVAVVSQQLIPRDSGEGRVAAYEVMITNNAIRNYIREGKTFQIPSVMLTNAKSGMKTMDDAILELYFQGLISKEDALLFAQDITNMKKRLMM